MNYFMFLDFQVTFAGEKDMIGIMTDKLDLKDLSLQLYGKEVEITLRDKSPSHERYKASVLKGILIGRIWGDDGRNEDTVIALMLRQGNTEMEIPCRDIYLLK
jgi:hypothetical protein